MNLNEMIVVVCWELDYRYGDATLEHYDPLVVPLGTTRGDVRGLVKHVYGKHADFEMYERTKLDSGRMFQCRMVSPGSGSPAKIVVISDPKGMKPTICWVADGDPDSLLGDARNTYPDREVEVSQAVRVEPTEREFRYFVLE